LKRAALLLYILELRYYMRSAGAILSQRKDGLGLVP
jgi:hypothetical protein